MPTLKQAKRPPRRAAARRTLLQAQLVRETLDGRPLYYTGYQAVLAGRKTTEEIRGSSSLQWVLVSYFMRVMILGLNRNKYWFATKAGVHLDHRDNLAHNVAIYEKAMLPPDQINTRYVQVPAKVVVEIDVRIDLQDAADSNYVNRKIRKLLDFGTERIIWIFTDSQQVLVAERGADAWLIMDWHRDLELLDGQQFNVGQYLQQQGISGT